MVENKDRRFSERFEFDDAKVYCQEDSTFGIFKQFSEPFTLFNLTKSGISFKTSKQISQGDQVRLKINIPGCQRIKIKGKVVWVSNVRQMEWAVGVQFLPFGTMKQYNSFTSREKLKRLINPLLDSQNQMLQ